jgi:hypothetical protein
MYWLGHSRIDVSLRFGFWMTGIETDIAIAVSTKWDAVRYTDRQGTRMDGMNQAKEADLLKEYPPIYEPSHLLTEPAIVIDMHGRILLWFLKDCLTTDRHVSR